MAREMRRGCKVEVGAKEKRNIRRSTGGRTKRKFEINAGYGKIRKKQNEVKSWCTCLNI